MCAAGDGAPPERRWRQPFGRRRRGHIAPRGRSACAAAGGASARTRLRIAVAPKAKTLCFNYASPYTTVWDDETVKKQLEYTVEYPPAGSEGFVLEL